MKTSARYVSCQEIHAQNHIKVKYVTKRQVSVKQLLQLTVMNLKSSPSSPEVYRGLRDFAAILRERGDTADAAYYDSFAKNITTSMMTLFSTTSGAFRMADLSTQTETTFYPGTTCQVSPQVFGATECAACFDRRWNFMEVNSPGWETGKLEPHPFAVLGFTVAKRGLTTLAKAQQVSIEKSFVANRPMISINELGFY